MSSETPRTDAAVRMDERMIAEGRGARVAWVDLARQLERDLAAARRDAQALPRFRHVKTGGVYQVLCECRREVDDEPMIAYRSEATNVVWVRPKTEFYDGRFAALAADDAQRMPKLMGIDADEYLRRSAEGVQYTMDEITQRKEGEGMSSDTPRMLAARNKYPGQMDADLYNKEIWNTGCQLELDLAAVKTALTDLLHVIEVDELIPESVSYMQQARAVLARLKARK
jgi:hypothetical protein